MMSSFNVSFWVDINYASFFFPYSKYPKCSFCLYC